MEKDNLNIYGAGEILKGITYPGRGIILGTTPDGLKYAAAYFITGRSENSRNRIFVKTEDGIVKTAPFDVSKVKDPSLIIYNAVRTYNSATIVTNGDQTDTVYDGLKQGKTFSDALTSRIFEPDAPNFTPRISGILYSGEREPRYELSILKKADEAGTKCNRYTFSYASVAGEGRFIRTYIDDGSPLPEFTGEPVRVFIPDTAEELAESIWNGLNADNKISVYVRYVDIKTGRYTDKLINKHGN